MRRSDGTEYRPKCPTCNTLVTQFVDIYMNFSSSTAAADDDEEEDGTTKIVDVIDVDNEDIVLANDQKKQQTTHYQKLVQKYTQELLTLKTQVNTLKDELQNTKLHAKALQNKQESMKLKLEATIVDNRKCERSVVEQRRKVTSVGVEKDELFTQLSELREDYERDIRTARTNSMAEVNEIMERNKKVNVKYNSLIHHVRTQERNIDTLKKQVDALKKQEAHTMQLMRQNVETQLEDTRKIHNNPSMSKAKQYADARRHMELEQEAEVKEAIAVRKRSQARAMMKGSSSQASRVFKAARISANINQGASTKVLPRSLSSVSAQESVVQNAYSDGSNTTFNLVESNLNFDGGNRSSKNTKKKKSINAILSPRTSTSASRHLVRGKPQQKKGERPSHSIMKWIS